ncbi:hypothetical protein F8M41_001027 [Gigaspora margarita]|uniref:Uncharacterized protein n=1 Tax=Gigaspora margarita TaxID=4874 RepID=A0A8H3XH08_GIGMA|nr:hypothetical protein F8M41_001027 [Gigaspora margarita]
MISLCSQCSKDDFKKSCDQKAYLKRKFKYNPKKIAPTPQNKVQNAIQKNKLVAPLQNEVQEGARPDPTIQAYREEIAS